jgi:carbon-monoxide dehydrogenase small subunit
MAKKPIQLNINEELYEIDVDPYDSLNQVLRERIGLTGTKRGCDTGGCGVCTVVVDGRAIYSCMLPVMQAVGRKVLTVEGLAKGEKLHPIQDAFVRLGGIQCGYCTPGMIMAAFAALRANPETTDEAIRDSLAGNLCRCTGYVKIVEAVLEAARQLG